MVTPRLSTFTSNGFEPRSKRIRRTPLIDWVSQALEDWKTGTPEALPPPDLPPPAETSDEHEAEVAEEETDEKTTM